MYFELTICIYNITFFLQFLIDDTAGHHRQGMCQAGIGAALTKVNFETN
jgi:hypothetical protein